MLWKINENKLETQQKILIPGNKKKGNFYKIVELWMIKVNEVLRQIDK